MTNALPAAVSVDGNAKVFYTPTIADTLNPTVAECASASGFDASCYFTDDGWSPSTDEQVVTDGRMCSRQVFEDIGTFTEHLQVKYIWRQQEPTAADNKAWRVWKRGVTGFYVVRYGTAFEDDIAAGDVVDIIPVRFDTQQRIPGARNEKQKIMQNVRIIDLLQRDVVVVS